MAEEGKQIIMVKKFNKYLNSFSILHNIHLLPQPHCVVSCQQGRYIIVATKCKRIPFAQIKDRNMLAQTTKQPLPFTTGIIGVVSYDAFAEKSSASGETIPSLFLRVEGALVFDLQEKCVWQTGKADDSFLEVLAEASLSASAECGENTVASLLLTADTSVEAYLATVQKIIADIVDGRYYLLNYLRYFTLTSSLPDVSLHAILLDKLTRISVPYKAYIQCDDTCIYSFSPERFVCLQAEAGETHIYCTPVKGTAPRYHDKRRDSLAAETLQNSSKDRAELHITVDLARNDLNRIAYNTEVQEADKVMSFNTVHHLVARIKATLQAGTTLQSFLQALCPAASISGAPKIEVMRCISAYETQRRRYFMGNIFCLDDSGQFDSSVLIRTVVRKGNVFTYAAGGGITLNSIPTEELHEVEIKTSFLL